VSVQWEWTRAFLGRDWRRLRDAKRRYWRERLARGGLAEALRITELLRAATAAHNPSWPTSQDRDEDLETHRRVAAALAATAPAQARRRAQHRALVDFAELAKRLRLRWYVFGAQAVNLHGFPRVTADLDLTLDLGGLTPAALIRALVRAGFKPRFTDEDFIAATRVIPVVHDASGLPIDLVLAGSGLEQQFLDEAVTLKVGRTEIPVLSPEKLVVTKLLAGRLLEEALDQADLRRLYRGLRDER
jgi:hypothetical protein